MNTRKITVVPNTGGQTYSFNTDVETIAELKEILDSNGISYDNSNLVNGSNSTQFLGDSAKLPDGAFSMFIMAKQHAKSGLDSDVNLEIEDEDDAEAAQEMIETLVDNLATYARKYFIEIADDDEDNSSDPLISERERLRRLLDGE